MIQLTHESEMSHYCTRVIKVIIALNVDAAFHVLLAITLEEVSQGLLYCTSHVMSSSGLPTELHNALYISQALTHTWAYTRDQQL